MPKLAFSKNAPNPLGTILKNRNLEMEAWPLCSGTSERVGRIKHLERIDVKFDKEEVSPLALFVTHFRVL